VNTRPSPLIAAAAMVLVTLACAQRADEFSVTDRTAIAQASNQYLTALTAGDAEAYAQLFTDDAQQLVETGGMLDGRSEIRSYAEQMASTIVDSESSNILVDGSGGLAYRWMDYSLTTRRTAPDTSGVESDTTAMVSSTIEGRLLSVYERQDDGTWLIVADTWSSAAVERPTAQATESASS